MKRYYIVSFPTARLSEILAELKSAGFEIDASYGVGSSPATEHFPDTSRIGGFIEDASLQTVCAVADVHVMNEQEVDPFLRRDQGGFGY